LGSGKLNILADFYRKIGIRFADLAEEPEEIVSLKVEFRF
jgi:hypothetical protein